MNLGRRGRASAGPQRLRRRLDSVQVAPVLRRHRWVRWLAPAGVLVLAALIASGVFSSGATAPARLPQITPDALLASLRTSPVTGYSGTVVSRVSLGLPELPDVGGGQDAASFAGLLSGSHTLQVWYGGAEEQRVAVLGATDETDVFSYHGSVWLWDGPDRIATHAELPKPGLGISDLITGLAAPHSGNPSVITPGGLVQRALAAIRPSTRIQVRRGAPVADRSAYELVLTPQTASTLVGSVRILIDGVTKVPLGVLVYPRGSDSPAIDVAYTSIEYGRPSPTSFQFAPPSRAVVHQVHLRAPDERGAGSADRGGSPRVVTAGSAWASAACYRLAHPRSGFATLGQFEHMFQPVSGSWGRGRLLRANLVSVLLTHDGWICAGAAEPSVLYAAAAKR